MGAGTNWTVIERLVFGPLVILAYLGVILFGASGHSEKAPEAATIIHDAMLTLGPIVGAVVYSVFQRPATDGGNGSSPTPPQSPAA